ncbi:MAG: TetR/AcrR family transcriptional regulator [Longimicrobiales bacterium]
MVSPANGSARETPDALIRAARGLFARHGYDGTSVRAITAEAGANLGAITYHFGSKRALHDRVIESYVGPLADRIVAITRSSGDVWTRVEDVVRAYFDFFAEHPDALRLMMQELVVGGAPPEVALRRLRVVHHALTALVHEGQVDRSIRAGNPAIMSVSIISQPVHLMLMQRPLQALTGMDLNDAAVRAQFVANAIAFVRGGLARGQEDRT